MHSHIYKVWCSGGQVELVKARVISAPTTPYETVELDGVYTAFSASRHLSPSDVSWSADEAIGKKEASLVRRVKKMEDQLGELKMQLALTRSLDDAARLLISQWPGL